MFDIGWSEMALIVMVALIVIGPKDLPRVARPVGKWTGKARGDGARVPALARRHGARGRAAGHQGRDRQAQPGRRPPPVEETIDPEGDLRRSLAAPVGCRVCDDPGLWPSPAVPSRDRSGPEEPARRRAGHAAAPSDTPGPTDASASEIKADAAHQGHRRARDAAARPSGRAAQPPDVFGGRHPRRLSGLLLLRRRHLRVPGAAAGQDLRRSWATPTGG